MEQMYNKTVPNNKVSERKLFMQNLSTNNEALKDKGETHRPHEHVVGTTHLLIYFLFPFIHLNDNNYEDRFAGYCYTCI